MHRDPRRSRNRDAEHGKHSLTVIRAIRKRLQRERPELPAPHRVGPTVRLGDIGPAGSAETSSRRCCSFDADGDGLDGVCAVAQPVPPGLFGLDAAGEVGGRRAYGHSSWLFDAGQQLPPLPAVWLAVPDDWAPDGARGRVTRRRGLGRGTARDLPGMITPTCRGRTGRVRRGGRA
jgi:hypothetical protein